MREGVSLRKADVGGGGDRSVKFDGATLGVCLSVCLFLSIYLPLCLSASVMGIYRSSLTNVFQLGKDILRDRENRQADRQTDRHRYTDILRGEQTAGR